MLHHGLLVHPLDAHLAVVDSLAQVDPPPLLQIALGAGEAASQAVHLLLAGSVEHERKDGPEKFHDVGWGRPLGLVRPS